MNHLRLLIDSRGIATVTIDRPDKHNAFSEIVVAELTQAFEAVAINNDVRALILTAEGDSFCAGADLSWMRRMAGYSHEENLLDAKGLATMLDRLRSMPKPTIARVQGSAYGGGVGLIACCDIAIGIRAAIFALTEVRLGLIPATISPYIVEAIGERAARRYFQTGERFNSLEARCLGLLHEVAEDEVELISICDGFTTNLLSGAPGAITVAKDLVYSVAGRTIDDELKDNTALRIAQRRATDEGREGVAAFLEKRKPNWAANS